MPAQMRFVVDITGPMQLFNNEMPRWGIRMLREALGTVAYNAQEGMRDELARLIYSQPEGDYVRTLTLWRATYASRPGANHDNDEAAARSGTDLRVTNVAGLVAINGMDAEIEVGAWTQYADHVHEGRGIGFRVPKPFSVRPAEDADRDIVRETEKVFAQMASAVLR